MGTAELRKYMLETYDSETGNAQYVVEDEIQISENGVEYLKTPEDTDCHGFEWHYIGTRAERLQQLLSYEDEY